MIKRTNIKIKSANPRTKAIKKIAGAVITKSLKKVISDRDGMKEENKLRQTMRMKQGL